MSADSLMERVKIPRLPLTFYSTLPFMIGRITVSGAPFASYRTGTRQQPLYIRWKHNQCAMSDEPDKPQTSKEGVCSWLLRSWDVSSSSH